MDLEQTQKALSALQYHAKWLVYGCINSDYVKHQFDTYNESDDKNTEHYRLVSFRYLLNRDAIDDERIAHYIELACCDEDDQLRKSVLIELIRADCLQNNQLESLEQYPVFRDLSLIPHIEEQIILRKLQNHDISDALDVIVDTSVQKHSVRIQRTLLSMSSIARHHVEVLAKYGANKAIRNQALSKLKSRKTSKK